MSSRPQGNWGGGGAYRQQHEDPRAREALLALIEEIEVAPDTGRPQLDTMRKVLNYARWMRSTGLVSSSFKTDDQIAIAIQAGKRLGFDELQSVQNIAVVGQQPRLWGVGLMAVINREMGKTVKRFSARWQLNGADVPEDQVPLLLDETGTNNVTCVVTHQRVGMECQEVSYSVQQAITAGLWWGEAQRAAKLKYGKSAQEADQAAIDSPWRKNPIDMLRWKARWRGAQADFSDLLLGMAPAEDADLALDDIEVAPRRTIAAPRAMPVAVPLVAEEWAQSKPEPGPVFAPAEPQREPEPSAAADDAPISDAQLKRLIVIQRECRVADDVFKEYLAAPPYEITSRKKIPRFLYAEIEGWLRRQMPMPAEADQDTAADEWENAREQQ